MSGALERADEVLVEAQVIAVSSDGNRVLVDIRRYAQESAYGQVWVDRRTVTRNDEPSGRGRLRRFPQ